MVAMGAQEEKKKGGGSYGDTLPFARAERLKKKRFKSFCRLFWQTGRAE